MLQHTFGSNQLESAYVATAGAISETEVVVQFITLLLGGLGVAYTLDRCMQPCLLAGLVGMAFVCVRS